MILSYIIGFILCIVTIYLLKHTVECRNNSILKVWHLLILLIVAIIPVINIAIGFITIVILIMQYQVQFYEFRAGNKIKEIWNFLYKRI